MSRSDIKLIVDVNSFTLYSTRCADKKFDVFKNRVLNRDNYTCSYCTFKARQHMTVINSDGDYLNNAIDNLVTACPFCAQCHFLPFVGKVHATGGTLIHMPDMTQYDINALCHVIFCVIQHKAQHHKNADKIYKSLKLRSQQIEECWGKELSNPSMLAQMLIDTPSDQIKDVQFNLLKDIRLLPSINAFATQIEDWSNSAIEQGITDPS